MRNVKILLVIDTLGRGGAEQVLVNVVPMLIERGFVCEVVATRPPYDLASALERAGVPVHRLDIREPRNFPVAVARLVGLVHRTRPDLIHSSLLFSITYTALARPFTRGVRRVATFQNVDYHVHPAKTTTKKIRKALDGFLCRNWIDRCTAVSKAVADYCGKELGLRNVAVIPNVIVDRPGTQLSNAERSVRRNAYGYSPDEFVLSVVGRLVPQKGHAVLLEAVEILAGRGLKPKVIMVGGGPLKSFLEQRITATNLGWQVVIRPPMAHEELMKLLACTDAFAMPSLYEGLPLAAVEAMSLGLPIVATRVTGLSELIEDRISGLLVKPKDPQALAEAIARLMSDSSLGQRLGPAARARIQEHYSAGTVCGQWDAFYREVTRSA
jgi:glycosyltransferase involved in cell wall biosynthesis